MTSNTKILKSVQDFKMYKLNNYKLNAERVGDEELLTLVEELDKTVSNAISQGFEVYGILHINGCSKEFVRVSKYDSKSKLLCVKRGVSNNYDNTVNTTQLDNKAQRYNSLYISFDDIPAWLKRDIDLSVNKDNSTIQYQQATNNSRGLIYTQYTPTRVDGNYKAKAITSDNPQYSSLINLIYKDGALQDGLISQSGSENLRLAKSLLGSADAFEMLIKLFFGDNPRDVNGNLTVDAVNRFNKISGIIKNLSGF